MPLALVLWATWVYCSWHCPGEGPPVSKQGDPEKQLCTWVVAHVDRPLTPGLSHMQVGHLARCPPLISPHAWCLPAPGPPSASVATVARGEWEGRVSPGADVTP